ncbi:MAG: T9SS type A sorting domain-containing protein [Flavobacteriales bacterium]|nr:T9SS type A sorting domain-containing protein [Flavobacteriales bacterium]
MKLLYTILFAFLFTIGTPLGAQTIHDIEAGGGGSGNPDPYYAPQFITIELGDIVRWTNSGGTHNVDGTIETFENNPEGFTSGDPSNALWVYEHTFTIPGVYDFECAAFDHNETQFGSVTVMGTGVGVNEYDLVDMDIYPNPSSDYLNVLMKEEILEAIILSTEMNQIESIPVSGLEKQIQINLKALPNGSYFLHIRTNSGKAVRRFLKN